MPLLRTLAATLLQAVSRRLSSSDQDDRGWGRAMLHELDAIESDWAAISWALGSAAALVRDAAQRGRAARLVRGLVSGMAIGAAIFLINAAGLLRLLRTLYPTWPTGSFPSAEWLTAVLAPEIVFVLVALGLWRSKRPIAAGVLVAAVALMIHFVVHLMSAQGLHASALG